MKTISLITSILCLLIISSCKKKEVEKDEIKYELISTASAPMNIDYGNEFGNINTEDFNGSTWSKTIDASKTDGFQISVNQSVSQNVGSHTIKARIYYKGELVNEEINEVTNTINFGDDLYVSLVYYK